MIKRYHEAPLQIFEEVQKRTDGDYALVHLFESDPEYLEVFKKAVAAGRDVILDNSIYELGTAFDSERYAAWIDELRPTWYIVPDCWKDSAETIDMFFNFRDKYPNLPGKIIGVAQGNTPDDVVDTYKAIEPYCDMVAFSLDFSSWCRAGLWISEVPQCLAMSLGRFDILRTLYEHDVINTEKPHHLLGCGVPQEVLFYKNSKHDFSWIRSIDTCNPVLLGMHRQRYHPEFGVFNKPSDKMCDMMHYRLVFGQRMSAYNNIETMKRWCE